jgi:hypothetical protein
MLGLLPHHRSLRRCGRKFYAPAFKLGSLVRHAGPLVGPVHPLPVTVISATVRSLLMPSSTASPIPVVSRFAALSAAVGVAPIARPADRKRLAAKTANPHPQRCLHVPSCRRPSTRTGQTRRRGRYSGCRTRLHVPDTEGSEVIAPGPHLFGSTRLRRKTTPTPNPTEWGRRNDQIRAELRER